MDASCITPNATNPVEFILTPVICGANHQFLKVPNSGICCSTPIVFEIDSPGLSPLIDERTMWSTSQEQQSNENSSNHTSNNGSSLDLSNQQPKPKQKQKQQKHLNTFKSPISLKGSPLSDLESSKVGKKANSSESSNTSNSFLNHHLSVTLILQNNGLDQYSEKFAKRGIDLEKFLKVKPIDLENISFQNEEDRQSILNIVSDLNTTCED